MQRLYAPLSAVLALQNTGVHISTINGSNKAADIEVVIDELLGCQIALGVLYIYLDNCQIGFWENLNNVWLRCNVDVVEYICCFDECFHHFKVNRHISIFHDVWDAKDF